MPLKNAFESKLVQVHIFGKAASGDLKRPWKVANFMGAGADDKKAIEQKGTKEGAKEE